MSRVEVQLDNLTNTCFVIMPFSAVFDAVYANVIRPAIEATGLSSVRADQIYSKPQIMADIWKALRSSRIVIAELSDKNANVFYELGLAHAIGKPVIIITRNEQDVPFDLKALRYLFYDINNPSWGDSLKKVLTDMIRSLLEEKEFGTVFDGITTIITAEFQQPKEKKSVLPSTIPNLTGVWSGQMTVESRFVYDLKLELKQTKQDLEGIMTICSGQKDFSVVEESMKGVLVNDNITLYGVSYTFLRKGGGEALWNLDSFQGKLSDKGELLSGKCTDTQNQEGSFSLKKSS